jgi:spermidine synthase
LRLTVVVAVGLNLVAGAMALTMAGSRRVVESSERDAPLPLGSAAAVPWYLLITFALVGATAISYEIAWSRLLVVTLSSSTYAFTLMLATFLAGIALGSIIFERWTAKGREVSVGTFGFTQTLTGLSAMLFLVLFQEMPSMLWGMVNATHKTFGGLVFAQFAICGLAMLPAATVFGFNFPVVTMLIAQSTGGDERNSNAVGRAYAANTVGAIVGAIAVGFWLIPLIGSFRVAAMTAATNLALAAYLATRRVPRRSLELVGTGALTILIAAAGWAGMFYDPAVANFGMITNRELYPKTLRLDEVVRLNDLIFSEDGLNASVAVVRSDNDLALRINGKTDASTGDQVTQLMLGHLGMMLHAGPRKVLIIGFGSGMTASAVARYPEVQQIDCVEIEPAVIHAASSLETLNHGVLRDPRLHIIEDDARSFLFTTPNQYDLIISEPSNPWIAGVATLFTDEFYRQARAHLAPDGMLVQWVQSYGLFPADLRMVMATLAHQFKQVSVWQGLPGDILLLAQPNPAPPFSLARLNRLWSVPSLRAAYQGMGMVRPEGLIAFHLLDDPDLRKLTANALINTDDLTQLEYHAPRAIFSASGPENIQMLARARSQLLPASISIPDKRTAIVGAAETLAILQERGPEEAFVSALDQYPASADIELLRGDWLAAAGKLDSAQMAFANVRRMDPSSIDAALGLGEIARLSGDYATAERLFGEVLSKNPKSVQAVGSYALLEKSQGKWKEALDWQGRRIAADPEPSADARAMLAELRLRTGDVRGAANLCIDILKEDPYNLDAHRFLGEILWKEKRWNDARVQLEVVVRYYPTADPGVYTSLADVYRNLDRPQDADAILSKGERVFKGNPVQVAAIASARP